MQRILPFRVFESRVTLTKKQEAWLNRCTRGSWSLNPAGEVDVEGDFECSNKRFKSFQGVKFGRVSGNFDCSDNGLTSLAGAPQKVEGYFFCSYNELTSLAGAPREVGEGFYCPGNHLTSLEGAPQEVGGDFVCHLNNLTSLKGAPREVKGNFHCENNTLTSLTEAPQTIEGEFISDMFKIPKGQWGLKGWLDAYDKGNAQARKLLLTLMGPDAINRKMKEAPEQTLIDLGPVWNDPDFDEIRAQIRVPDRYEDEMGLLGDLGELGF